MASSYVNDLRLNEMATGDASGTWGTTTNTNLELIGEALGYGTEGITTNADTHTSTIADGATDPVRAMYVEYTGTLDSACTITIAPNTVNRMQFIENGTSGSQNIIISQGSGANITIPPGDVKAVYLDGAGSGAAVVDAFASLNVVDLKVQDDLTVTDDATIGGTLGVTGIVTLTDDLIIGDDKTIGSASDVDAMTIAANGQITLTQTLIGTALDISGDIDVDGTTNLDVVDIDGATNFGADVTFTGSSYNIVFDQSDNALEFADSAKAKFGASDDLQIFHVGTENFIRGNSSTSPLYIDVCENLNIRHLDTDGSNAETMIKAVGDGAVELYHNNSKKLDTTSTGIDVTGTVTATGTSVFASLDISGDIDVDGTTNLDVVDIDGAVDMATTALVTGVLTTTAATVFNGGFASNAASTISTADNTDTLQLISTDADADVAPNLRLYRNSGSPADNDQIGKIQFEGRNDNSQDVIYSEIINQIKDASDGTEDGRIALNSMVGGTLRARLDILPTETVFNDGSIDLDFRVESNGNANMLFVDGGNDDFLIGNTTVTPASSHSDQAGFGYQSEGVVEIANTNNAAGLVLGKNQGTDGSFIDFRKQGAALGSISVVGGNNLTISGTQTNHCGLSFATNAILPATQSATNNNTVDLGASSNAYKDLYLGGSLFVGGTAAANGLDDYEEGTFDVAVGRIGSDATADGYAVTASRYVKVGKMVTAWVNVKLSGANSGGTAACARITGLPFAGANYGSFKNPQAPANIGVLSTDVSDKAVIFFVEDSSASLQARIVNNADTILPSNYIQNGTYIVLTITYDTA